MDTSTQDKAPQPIQPPTPVEQWVRFRRIGDQLTIWDVGFHPTLGHDLLFDGAAGDPSVIGILSDLRILSSEPTFNPAGIGEMLAELHEVSTADRRHPCDVATITVNDFDAAITAAQSSRVDPAVITGESEPQATPKQGS